MTRNIPEYLRRALRLLIATATACAIGFALLRPLGGWHSRWGSQTMMGTKWAAITSVVINHPVISKTGEAAVERVLGTVAGGVLGYLLAIFNDCQPFYEEPFITVTAVAGVAFTSVILGYKLQLDYAGRLFIMTFILVAMAAPTKDAAFAVAVTRISGIVFGVLMATVLSVLVFPKSASHQATDNLKAGLQALAELNEIAWKRHDGDDWNVMEPVKYGDRKVTAQSRLSSDGLSSEDAEHVRVVLEPEELTMQFDKTLDDCCDQKLSEVYRRMSKTQEFTDMSKSETYVFTNKGRWCFLPAFKCFPWRTALPIKEMHKVTESARKVARLLWCLHASLPDEQDIRAIGHYWGAHEFLESLGSSLQIYLGNVASCFPGQHHLECSDLHVFIEGVEILISASYKASQDQTILLQAPYRRRRSLASFSDSEEEDSGAEPSAIEALDLTRTRNGALGEANGDHDGSPHSAHHNGPDGGIAVNGHSKERPNPEKSADQTDPPGQTSSEVSDKERPNHFNGGMNGHKQFHQGRAVSMQLPGSAPRPGGFPASKERLRNGEDPEGWKERSKLNWRKSIARTLSSAQSLPLDTLSSHNVAFIVGPSSVTRVGGPRTAGPSPFQNSLPETKEGEDRSNSPVTEILLEEASSQAVRKAAKGAGQSIERTPSTKAVSTKQSYYSQVQWQATQFLLQRLAQEVAYLNVAFISLSVLLPPTRWESRRKKRSHESRADMAGAESLNEPLLRE